MATKKSLVEKLNDSKDLPRVIEITEKMSKRWGEGTCVIPSPLEVDAIMKKVPEGKLITIKVIREILADKHKATIGCPLTTGIFAWVAANAAEEERASGKNNTTPYWRTLKSDGSLNEKYPGGIDQQRFYLEAEGHKVVKKGKKYIVSGFEESIM